ncbi:MAG: UvrD-helicase domain-containing protein, partial [Planctomycetota bacterium]|nr:UvrD-helicase domain-containing protein [Planctomycetota bacterium]
RALLRALTRNLHRLQMRTLDSFFASVVRSFAIELGLPRDCDVLDDAEAAPVRLEAMQLMLDERDPQRLITLLRRITQGDSARSVVSLIDRTVTSLHELYREAPAEAWDRLPRRAALKQGDIIDAIETLRDTYPGAHRGFVKAHVRACESARARDWESFLTSGLASRIARGDLSYYSKPIEDDLIEAYRPLIGHAQAAIINRVREQAIAMRDILGLFDAHERQVKQRRRVMTFRDITGAMLEAQQRGTFAEICFRIDASIRHLLLDEFQDTSIRQWRALAPIAHELISGDERSFFCVGDVKQSIYGWRDACPEVLDELGTLLAGPGGESAIEQRSLARSWRSSPIIIDVINRVFGGLTENAALADFAGAARRFSQGFKTHETTKTNLPGCAELRTALRPGEEEDRDQVRLSAAAAWVKTIHDHGRERRIGVLTRTNKAVARLLYELGPGRYGIPAAGRGGGSLTEAPAVNAVLDLLRLADHPDDTVAAFNVARGPLGEIVEFTNEQAAPRRRQVARLVRRMVFEDGYAATIAAWTKRLAPSCDERQYRRLMQLVQLAGEYDPRATLRADDFVRFAEGRVVASAGPAPVQVMTIHQAKGLEFDIVVLPDLEGSLAGGHAPVAIERDGPTGPVTRICPWVNEKIRGLLPEIEPLFERHRLRAVRESLCVLYVAMTRAKQGLYMLIDPPNLVGNGSPTETIPKTAAGVLRCALTGGAPPEPDVSLYQHGDADWLAATPAEGEAPKPPRPGPAKIVLAAPTNAASARRGAAAAPASASSGAAASLHAQLRLTDDEPRDRGTAMHKLFEQIEWLEEFEVEEDRLVRLVRQAAPRRDRTWAVRIVGAFMDAVSRPAIRAALGRGGRPPQRLRVRREHPFVRLVDGRVQSGFIDRLVIEFGEDGTPAAAEIIDFKTDAITADEAAAHAEAYRGQLAVYRAAAARLLKLDESVVRMTILFVEPALAVRLDGESP